MLGINFNSLDSVTEEPHFCGGLPITEPKGPRKPDIVGETDMEQYVLICQYTHVLVCHIAENWGCYYVNKPNVPLVTFL